MKAYLLTTGTVFGLITVAHIWRMIFAFHSVVREPVYLALTIVSAALCVWAFRLVRSVPKS